MGTAFTQPYKDKAEEGRALLEVALENGVNYWDTSLRKLKTDHLDLLHMWNLKADEDLDRMEKGCFRAIQKLKDDKVISHYALSLDGIHCAIVGLDSLAHLNENVQMATDFQAMPENERAALSQTAIRILAETTEPWHQPGYQDGAIG